MRRLLAVFRPEESSSDYIYEYFEHAEHARGDNFFSVTVPTSFLFGLGTVPLAVSKHGALRGAFECGVLKPGAFERDERGALCLCRRVSRFIIVQWNL